MDQTLPSPLDNDTVDVDGIENTSRQPTPLANDTVDADCIENKSQNKRKMQHRFFASRNIIFLKTIDVNKPWAKAHGGVTQAWEKVASDYNNAVGQAKAINTTGAKHHWDALLKKYKSEERDSLRASGTAEEYTEQEELLAKLAAHYDDFKFCAKEVSEKLQKKVMRKSYP